MDPIYLVAFLVIGFVGALLNGRAKKRAARPTPGLPLHADGSACTGGACHNVEHTTLAS